MTVPAPIIACPSIWTMTMFVADRLAPDSRRRVLEHLAVCTNCCSWVLFARRCLQVRTPGRVFGSRYGLLACVVAAVLLLASAVPLFQSRFLAPKSATAALVERSGSLSYRLIEGRLAGGFPYRPMVSETGVEARKTIDAAAKRAAALQISATHGLSAAEALHVDGVVYLLTGDSLRAVTALERAVEEATDEIDILRAIDKSTDGELINDLAAAYHVRGIAGGGARDHVASLDASERAWTLHQSPETAWNLAIALEATVLKPEAAAAWRRYLALDPASGWSQEAQRRLATLTAASQFERWKKAKQQIEAGLAASPLQTRGIVEQLCRYIEEEMLTAWADAISVGDTQHAGEIMARSHIVAQQLCEQTGECLTFDSIQHIDEIAHNHASRAREIAEGFQAWAAAIKAGKQHADARHAHLSRALASFHRDGLPLAARVEMHVVNASFDANDFGEGLSKVESIGDEYGPAMNRSPLLRGQVRWLRGMFLIATGQPGKALVSYRSALAEFESVGAGTGLGMIELLIAENYRHIGELDEAWEYHLRSIDDLGRSEEALRLIIAISSAGKTAAREKYDRVALIFDEAALAIAVRERKAEYECQALVSRALIGGLSAADAERYVRDAEEIWNRIPDEPTRRRFAIELQMARALSIARTSPERAIDVLTRARDMAIEYHDPFRYARVHLLRAQLYDQVGRPEAAELDLVRGIEEVERQRARIEDGGLRGRFIETGDELFAALAANLMARGRILDALEVAERRRARVMKERLLDRDGLSTAFRAKDIQRHLPHDVAVVEYLWTNDGVLFWVLTHEDVRGGRIAASHTIDRTLHRLQEPTSRDDAANLYELLLRRVPLEGVRHVMFVPDGPLSRLAFSTLYDRRTSQYLIERCAISVVPSAAFVVNSMPRSSGPPESILLVADPKVASKYADMAPPLLGARSETKLTKGFARAVILQGQEATPSRLLELAPANEVIHFAGHALGGGAMHAAALALSPDARSPDGLLSADDIDRRRFNYTRLVVLAACSTSLGRVGSEGTMSLARAFEAAGARNVIGSLWPVGDDVTALLWPLFYDAVHRGASPAEALRIAQVSLLRHPYYGDPHNWAAFQVAGPVD